mmetsp:Transcript_32537/g.92839  ORF Transcript_32537/g.92839 Transcript_32537/m.92839 type:complete len:203 (-) Transcript_32537:1078-1686(-)
MRGSAAAPGWPKGRSGLRGYIGGPTIPEGGGAMPLLPGAFCWGTAGLAGAFAAGAAGIAAAALKASPMPARALPGGWRRGPSGAGAGGTSAGALCCAAGGALGCGRGSTGVLASARASARASTASGSGGFSGWACAGGGAAASDRCFCSPLCFRLAGTVAGGSGTADSCAAVSLTQLGTALAAATRSDSLALASSSETSIFT